jgi:glutathionylspermidine synthase
VSFLVDEDLSEDSDMARLHMAVIHEEVPGNIYTQIVGLRGELGMADEYFFDADEDRILSMWKIYDWTDLQHDFLGFDKADQLLGYKTQVIEPMWKQVVSNKGALAMMWALYKDHEEYSQFLLPTFFESDMSPEATQVMMGTYVRKPLYGMEGVGISIHSPVGILAERDQMGYGAQGFIIQEYMELPSREDYSCMVGAWLMNEEYVGCVVRGDSKITGRNPIIVPHYVMPTND